MGPVISKNRPRVLIWLLTARCNLACAHCYTARFVGQTELSEDEALGVLKDAARAGVRHVGLSGGEPFLRQDTVRLVQEAARLGMTSSVVSNGSLMTEALAERLAPYPVAIFLSLDGTRGSHEGMRGAGAWDSAVAAAGNMRRAGLRFCTIMALTRTNYAEVGQYVATAKELGAAAACLIPVMPTGRAKDEMTVGPAEIAAVLGEAEEAAERLRFAVSLWCMPFAGAFVSSRLVSSSFCRQDPELNISPNGDVLLCDILDDVLSNVKEKGILAAYREQERHPLVRSLAAPKLSEPCSTCPIARGCLGGCFARAQLISGDLFAADPLCPRVGLG